MFNPDDETKKRAKFYADLQDRIYLEVIQELPPGTQEECIKQIFSKRYLRALYRIKKE